MSQNAIRHFLAGNIYVNYLCKDRLDRFNGVQNSILSDYWT